MDANRGSESEPVDLTSEIRKALLELARKEDELAAAEAAGVPYWAAYSPEVHGHHIAAEALRAEADNIALSA